MTQKTRHIMFRTFVVLFVVLTLFLSLYATGYRVNPSWPLHWNSLLLKTGTLALNSTPRSATVTIASETKISPLLPFLKRSQSWTTPVKIKNLLPGEYVVTFNLDGYWPYQKKLPVYPEQTTFLEDIILFKKSTPLNIVAAAKQPVSYSPDGASAWLEKTGELINLKTEQKIASTATAAGNWSDDSQQFCAGAKLINLETGNVNDLTATIGQAEKSQLNGKKLTYLAKNKLSIFDLDTKTSTLIPTEGTIKNYWVDNNLIFIVTNDKNKTFLKAYDQDTKTYVGTADLLNANAFSFNGENTDEPILTDQEHQIAYLLSISQTDSLVNDIIRNAAAIKWLDGNKLAYASASEIYIYDRSQTKSYFITRLSQKIISLAWNPNNYLTYATAKEIGTIDLNNAGNNITILASGNDLSSLYLNKKSTILYFSDGTDNSGGLYKLALK